MWCDLRCYIVTNNNMILLYTLLACLNESCKRKKKYNDNMPQLHGISCSRLIYYIANEPRTRLSRLTILAVDPNAHVTEKSESVDAMILSQSTSSSVNSPRRTSLRTPGPNPPPPRPLFEPMVNGQLAGKKNTAKTTMSKPK